MLWPCGTPKGKWKCRDGYGPGYSGEESDSLKGKECTSLCCSSYQVSVAGYRCCYPGNVREDKELFLVEEDYGYANVVKHRIPTGNT